MKAYTRTLLAKIMLKQSVGYMGKELRVVVVHFHFQVANKNKGFRRNNDEFWPWLADKLKQHNIQVLMGDFNMSLFKVVPELHGTSAYIGGECRQRGVQVQLSKWCTRGASKDWRSQWPTVAAYACASLAPSHQHWE